MQDSSSEGLGKSNIFGARTSTVTIIDDITTPPPIDAKVEFSWPEAATEPRTGGRKKPRHHHKEFLPIWLRSGTLLATAAFTAGLAAGLIVLWRIADSHDGITLITSNHYLWTYGPTALLVVLVSVWRQLDYASKTSTPWDVLRRGNASANQSVLLDYISPLQFLSFGQALKSRHPLVVATVLGFALLKLVTLASTGLLILEPITVRRSTASLTLSSIFDGTLYNETEYSETPDPSLVYKAFGISAYNLSHPEGLGNGTAYETFSLPRSMMGRDVLVTSERGVFVANFSCEAARVDINISSDDGTSIMTIVEPPSCVRAGLAEPSFVFDRLTLQSTVVPRIQRRGTMLRVDCFNETDVNRQLIVLAEVAYEQDYVDPDGPTPSTIGQPANITGGNVVISQVQSLICRPSYSMTSTNVTYNMAQDPPIVSVSNHNQQQGLRKLQQFSNGDLGFVFNAAFVDAGTTFGDASTDEFVEDLPNAMLKMMVGADTRGYAGLFGDGVMASRAQNVFASVAAQIATKTLRKPVNQAITGQIVFTRNRLQVSQISLWLMFAGLLLLVASTAVVWVARPRNALGCHEDPLAEVAAVLANSQNVSNMLHGASVASGDAVERKLRQLRFSFTLRHGFGGCMRTLTMHANERDASPTLEHTSAASEADQSTVRFWQPLMLRRIFVALTICLPFVAIAALETISQVASRHDNGIDLFRSHSNLSDAFLYSRFVPALVMLLIATMFNAVDFNIALLSIYSTMRKRPLSFSQAGTSLIAKLPIVALCKTVQLRLWPAWLSTLAASLGSVLTIIVAGLYTIERTADTQLMRLPRAEIFNIKEASATVDNGTAAVLMSLLEGTNLSFPANTHRELAFPHIGIDRSPALSNLAENASLSVRVPALRASLECTTLERTQYNFSTDFNARILTSTATLNSQIALPQSCQLSDPSMSSVTVGQTFTLTQNQSYIGALLDISVDLTESIFGTGAVQSDLTQQPPSGCPSLAFVYGYADVNNPVITTANILICTQHIDSLDTLTFFTPEQTILNTSFSESLARRLSSSPSGDPNITSFPFSIQKPLDQSLSLFNQSFFTSTTDLQSPVDPFFQGVLFGKTPLYPSKYTLLASTQTEDRKVVFDAIQTFYRRYMAQAISGSMRQTIEKPNPRDAWEVTVYDNAFVFRLRQHNASKIILQVLLGLMATMLTAAYLMMETREVVMMNPCTIVGKLVLLAGSRLVDVVGREGVDAIRDRNVMLGWWSDGKGGRRWGLDLADKDEKDMVEQGKGGLGGCEGRK